MLTMKFLNGKINMSNKCSFKKISLNGFSNRIISIGESNGIIQNMHGFHLKKYKMANHFNLFLLCSTFGFGLSQVLYSKLEVNSHLKSLLVSKNLIELFSPFCDTIHCHNNDGDDDANKKLLKSKNNSCSDETKKDTTHSLWRSKESRPFDRKYDEAIVFSGNSNLPLAKSIAECLGTQLGKICLNRFADGEVNLQYLESLRGKNIFLVQSTSPPVNEHLVELLLMISTARRSSAKRITAIIPYYGYSRQDRKLHSRVPISAADVAKMVEVMGVDRVISVDLHCGQIQGFFGPRVPVDNLEAQIIGLEYFAQKKLNKIVVLSPDAGGVYRARKFQEGLEHRGVQDVGIAMLVKHRLHANTIEKMDLVGNVDGCDVIIVDDMIDTAGTLCEAAFQLRKNGARRVFAFATHGLFSGKALERIENSLIEEVVICNTIQQRPETTKSTRITCLSLAILIADAIRRIHQKESLEQLFGGQD